jgi:hypothetical protein
VTPGRYKFRKIKDVDKSMPKEWIPYIAGLLDGEGGFSIKITNKNPPRFQAHIALQMTHEETVKHFAKMCGVTYNRKLSKRGGPLYYALINTQDDLEKLLEMLSPWLITKKRHAELILRFFSLKKEVRARRKGLDLSTEKNIRSELVDIFVELRKLNPKSPRIDYNKLREELQKEVAGS